MNKLELKNISVCIGGTERVHDVSLVVPRGKVVALMGPNGSGKSSLVHAVMGNPKYQITGGAVLLDGEDITHMPAHEKARKGLFLSFQYPPELAGVTVSHLLRSALQARRDASIPVLEFRARLEEEMNALGIEKEMAARHVNAGFSGGEKKRLEALQLAVLKPSYALLDETDSGLDVDALKLIAENIQRFQSDMGILVITHYARMLKYLIPDEVHIMQEGKIIRSGGKELAEEIEEKGYK